MMLMFFFWNADSLRCISILYDCLKNLNKKVNEIHLLTTNDVQIKGTQELKEVNDAIKFINEKFKEFEADRREKEQELAEIKSTINNLNVRLDKADRDVGRQEQYSRRNCLLIYGINEENQGNTDEVIINVLHVMDEEITHQDIDRSHHLGDRKLDKNNPRPIVIKFPRYNVRAKIFKKKRKLEEKRINITESLTKTRMENLQKAREEHIFWNVWSNNGKIFQTLMTIIG